MLATARVVVRGASMGECEREALILLDHLSMAGMLEGVAPDSRVFSDHHFENVMMTRKFEDGPEAWTELGLPYLGRIAVTFDPGVVRGGVKQFGFEVIEVDDYTPHGLSGHPGSEREPIRTDVTEKVFVLHRINEVTRDTTLAGNLLPLPQPPLLEAPDAAPVADSEEILDNIRRLVNVENVEVGYDRSQRDGSGWRVTVTFVPDGRGGVPMALSSSGETLREAALSAYGGCGVEVTHYDTVKDGQGSGVGDGCYEVRQRLAQVLGWGDFRECSAGQQEQFAAWAKEVGLPHLGNPHIRKELFAASTTEQNRL